MLKNFLPLDGRYLRVMLWWIHWIFYKIYETDFFPEGVRPILEITSLKSIFFKIANV